MRCRKRGCAPTARSTISSEATLPSWLLRIVVEEALARRHKRAHRAEVVPLRGRLEDICMRKKEGPEDLMQRTEMRKLLEARIDRLSEALRVVFVLRAIEEMTVAETAAILNVPEATVRTRFFRARRQLREALSQQIDLAVEEVFAFAGERCERIVARVLERIASGT